MIARAHTADYAQQESLPLPLDFDELLSTVSEAFALQLQKRRCSAATAWPHLGHTAPCSGCPQILLGEARIARR